MKNALKIPLSFLFIILNTGCAETIDRTLSPPSDTRWVNVEVKNPSPWTRPFPLEVTYISNTCKHHYLDMGDGTRRETVGHSPVTIPLEQQENSNIWQARVAMNGGGSCDWKLSEFDLGIEYIDATHLGKDLVPGTAVGATIAFDDLASQNGQFKSVLGNLILTPKYFPYIARYSMVKDSKERDKLYLFGAGDSFLSYRILPDGNENYTVLFEPSIDEKKIAEMIFPYQKGNGVHTKVIYPDKTEKVTENARPDFKKMYSIK
ncbi:hypothetical protein [Enterobacter ludwigii]|uniref:hypothetical protein n=1 Tax=Enterobacter ludwigii TaxID=299767 RepID=UPI003F6FC6E0